MSKNSKCYTSSTILKPIANVSADDDGMRFELRILTCAKIATRFAYCYDTAFLIGCKPIYVSCK